MRNPCSVDSQTTQEGKKRHETLTPNTRPFSNTYTVPPTFTSFSYQHHYLFISKEVLLKEVAICD